MTYLDAYRRWLDAPALTAGERAELEGLSNLPTEQEARFFGPLEFGTAGLRGIMGTGLNRMNLHVIRHATQAFADVIAAEGSQSAARGVALCFDCRHNSEAFAQAAAGVMAANGIPVRIFEAMRPTPELSFAIREYGCIAGINITASHNPRDYNGYKVYWEDGAQLPPHHAAAIAARMAQLDVFADVRALPFEQAVARGMVTVMGAETDARFLEQVMAQASAFEAVRQVADTFKMVYTPFHGTGYQLIPEVLARLGLKHVLCVPEQMVPDGDFSTVASPNPENPESFALAVELARRHNADFILGSDPDADRVGIMVRDRAGEYVTISGNQTGVLLLDYLIGARRRAGTLPERPVALKTIVTTDMARKVAERSGVSSYDTFTGFKFMAEKKNALEAAGAGKVIFSYEESYGYMIGDYVRDKDAVTAALLLAEMAAWYASQGLTLYDALQRLYEIYGYHQELTLNLVMPGLDGLARMKTLMAHLRAQPPVEIGGASVTARLDYQDGSRVDAATGVATALELSGSNVLRYELADGTSILVRPSGTEPKVKVYILASDENQAACAASVARYSAWANALPALA